MDSGLTTFSVSIVVLAGVVMGALIFTLVTSGRFTRVTEMVGRSFWCPYVARRVTAEIQEDMRTGRAVDVSWCTAFVPAVAMRCGKPCLRQPGFMRPAHLARQCGVGTLGSHSSQSRSASDRRAARR